MIRERDWGTFTSSEKPPTDKELMVWRDGGGGGGLGAVPQTSPLESPLINSWPAWSSAKILVPPLLNTLK